MAVAAIAGAVIVSLSMNPGRGEQSGYSDLLNLTMGIEDTRMNAQDLAFLLVTHDVDARPKDDYVMVKLNGTVYKLTPNKDLPGLAEMTPMK